MTDDRRMSTVRFYGGIEDRLEILTNLFSHLSQQNDTGVPHEEVIDWIVSNTNAKTRNAVGDRLNFLEELELIESQNDRYSLTQTSRWYLRDRDPIVLYDALRTSVKGFDTILCAVALEPRSDEDLMEVLVNTFEECQMETPGVATRHREWLQMLGYVERRDERIHFTSNGEAVANQLKGISAVELEPGKTYNRRELHSKYGGSIQGGIAPSRDEPVVFLFSGGTGEDHGYQDELQPNGTVIYTGEGQVGDMEMKRGNKAIRNHLEDGRELHFFTMENYGIRYVGQYLYAGHFFEELPDSEGNSREGIRFKLSPVDIEIINQTTGQQRYADDATPEYNSLEHALEDVRSRLSHKNEGPSWLKNRIGDAVIEDWSDALTGFRPANEVEPDTAAKLDQIRRVYERLESKLETKADELGIGTLDAFTPAQTLFLCGVRLVQEEFDISGPFNQPRLNSVLTGAYTTPDERPDRLSNVDHPLADHIENTEPTVYKFTAPPDYWLTTVEFASVSFEPDQENQWNNLEKGDIALLHSRAEPSNTELTSQPSGVIGVGIIGDTFEKSDLWWLDEYLGRKEYSMIASFERLFLTSDITHIDTTRRITEKETTELEQELDTLTANCLPIEKANQICVTASGIEFPVQSMFDTFRTEDGNIDYDRPMALIDAMADDLTEVSPINPHKPLQSTLPKDILEGLHFEDDLGEKILEQISTALRSGKHVLLTGPPGTGKTEIAERVCEYLTESHPYLYSGFQMTTATADWSTFDTVGGYMPSESTEDGDNLSFKPGLVLNRLKNTQTNTQANDLLVIDELNRADIDKAFGQLFTLLSGQSVQLPYTVDGKEVELTTYEDVDGTATSNQYVVPNSWRIFATMNAYDKTSLYEMSYAFMRRFAFVRVPAPTLPEETESDDPVENIVFDYADAWDLEITRREAGAVGRVWRKANTAVDERAIGPAIIEDVLRYVSQHPDKDLKYHLTQAVISYIFPQLEGVPKRKTIVRELTAVPDIDTRLLEDAAREMLQVTLTTNE